MATGAPKALNLSAALLVAATSLTISGCTQVNCTAVLLSSHLKVEITNTQTVSRGKTLKGCVAGTFCSEAPINGERNIDLPIAIPAGPSGFDALPPRPSVEVAITAGDGRVIAQQSFEGVGTVTSTGGDCSQDIWNGTVIVDAPAIA